MSWMLHKKKGKDLYSIYSTVVDDYIEGFHPKEIIQEKLEKRYIELAKYRAKDFMEEVDEEVD